jgi:HD domain
MLGEIGTLEWTRRSNGILGRRERARYVAATLLTQARVGPRLLLSRRGRRGPRTAPDPSLLAPPDSRLADEAVERCAELMPRSFLEHSYRSYVYARALGEAERVRPDEELLFVATMCHDVGAVTPDTDDGGRCFTLAGADLAERLLEDGARPARPALAAEAITLHINPEVPLEQGVEAHLMHDGVLMDAVGLRAWELDHDLIEAARERHPRLGFGRAAVTALGDQARAIPGCRIAAAMRCGFGLSVRLRG